MRSMASADLDFMGGRGAVASRAEATGERRLGFDAVCLIVLALWVVGSRLPCLNTFDFMGKDGPLYIESMKLDASFSVPMPGNIGYVILGKVAHLFVSNPVEAFLAVNIALTIVGAWFAYLFASLWISRPLAAASAFALTCNPMVWWHAGIVASYPVWLAVLPAVGWFGARYQHNGKLGDLIGCSAALGLGMILRPDLLFFGTPLWFGCLLLGRASIKHWLIGIAILAVACCVWFFGTSWVLGGVGEYLGRVEAKHEGDKAGFSLFQRGLYEGLARNVVKYGLFLAWGSILAVPPFVAGLIYSTRPRHWRALLIAALWVGPSWAFSFIIFAGNAGLIFPFLPLLYLGAAVGLRRLAGERPAVVGLVAIGLMGAVQFGAAPLLTQHNQRDVILNVTFLRYTAAGINQRYNFNLDDFGVSPALADVRRQMRNPEPIPQEPELRDEQIHIR